MARVLALAALVNLSGCSQGSEKAKVPVDTTIEVKVPEAPKSNQNNQPPPVSMAEIRRGGENFSATYREGGMDGAQIESEKCFESLKINPSWAGLDYCMSYDLSASVADNTMSKTYNFELRQYFDTDASFVRWEEIATIITGEKYTMQFLKDRIDTIITEVAK